MPSAKRPTTKLPAHAEAAGATARAGSRMTLRDLARALGVSVATVSNAYNRPDQLSAQLRERILQSAHELGYQGPDPLARSLRRGKTGVIGLVYDAPLDYAFADPAAALFLGSVARTIQQQNLNLLLLSCPDTAEPVQTASVDGFIVYCSADDSPLLRAVLARQLPAVLVEQRPLPGLAQVGLQDEEGAAEAARHLSELGHREIGVLALEFHQPGERDKARSDLTGKESLYQTTAQRLRGYQRGAPHARLHVREAVQNTPQEGEELARELLSRHPQLTALLCMSDVLAQGAMNAARALGRRIPEDLSLIGFDDLPSSAALNLSSVWQPTAEKGRQAGELMMAQLAGQPPQHLTLPTRLVLRGTTAKARDA